MLGSGGTVAYFAKVEGTCEDMTDGTKAGIGLACFFGVLLFASAAGGLGKLLG